MNPKTEPAFPCGQWQSRNGELLGPYQGLSQYAEIAARFHTALLAHGVTDNHEEAFDEADAFFAELEKRTK